MHDDSFQGQLGLTEFEAYIIAAAMKIAAERSKESETAARLRERVTQFILKTWPAPDIERIKASKPQ